MALINIDKLKNSFDPNLLAHPVCFDLAKTWTIFNPLKKFSPNTLASRKARAAPLDQIFFSFIICKTSASNGRHGNDLQNPFDCF